MSASNRPLRYSRLCAYLKHVEPDSLLGSMIAMTLNHRRIVLKVRHVLEYPYEKFGLFYSDDSIYSRWIWGRSRVSQWIESVTAQALFENLEALCIAGKMFDVEVIGCSGVTASPFRAVVYFDPESETGT